MAMTPTLQAVTGSDKDYTSCVPPNSLHGDSEPTELLQQQPLLPQFAAYVEGQGAFTAMHPRMFISNMAGLEVCCL